MKKLFFALSVSLFLSLIPRVHEECLSHQHQKHWITKAKADPKIKKLLRSKVERFIGEAAFHLGNYLKSEHKTQEGQIALQRLKGLLKKELECSDMEPFIKKILKHFDLKDTHDAITQGTQQLHDLLNGIIDNYNSVSWGAAWYIAYWDEEQCLSSSHVSKLGSHAVSDLQKRKKLIAKLEKIAAVSCYALSSFLLHSNKSEKAAESAADEIENAIETELHCIHAIEIRKALFKQYGFESLSEAIASGYKQLDAALDQFIAESESKS